jgi:hypothetical protein
MVSEDHARWARDNMSAKAKGGQRGDHQPLFPGNQLRFSGELEQGLRLGGVPAAFTFNAILYEHSSILGGGW